MRLARAIAAIAIALGVAALPDVAVAHAAFVSSDPEPGERLQSAPGAVRLRFSEPLNPRLSNAAVVDPSGRRFRSTSIAERDIGVPLRTNAPGEYEVRWTTVSPLDGHTLRGSFRFGVGVTPSEGEAATSLGPGTADTLVAVARALEYAGLLTMGGMLLLIRLSRRAPPLDWVRPRLPIAAAVALAGGVAVVAGETAMATSSLSGDTLAAYLTTGLPGWARLTRVGAETVAFVAAIWGARWIVLPAVVVAIGALSGAGHAAALRPAWWGIGIDAVHVGSAALWAGGILAFATIRPQEGWGGEQAGRLLNRFSSIALNAFALTIATGYLRATQELSTPSDLWTSSYGRILGLKIVGVLAMVPLSVRAWRRVGKSLRSEALLGGVVVALAALLAAYPLPPGRVAEADEEEEQTASSDRALPREGDLSMADGAGRTLVGLTLRPGEPGRNDLFVFLLPLSGPEAAADMHVALTMDDRDVPLRTCGAQCRRADHRLDGGESVTVRVGGVEGGDASFDIPDLPAPDGRALARAATKRMERLETLQMDETLGPGDPLVRNEYAFRAPDRMHLRGIGRFENIAIGTDQYRRSANSDKWSVTRDSPPIDAPLLTWQGFKARGPQIVARERVDGVRSDVVAFFTGTDENPIWFRLWVGDPDRLVRRMEMRAYGHFMDQRLFGFDEPVRIEPPR